MKVSTEIDNNFGYEKNHAAGRQYPFNNSSLRVLAYRKNTLITDWTVGNLNSDLTPAGML
jgi:hypothetical protein